MNTRNIRKSLTHYGIGLGIFLGGYALVAISPWSSSEPEIASEVAGVGSVSNLQKTMSAGLKATVLPSQQVRCSPCFGPGAYQANSVRLRVSPS